MTTNESQWKDSLRSLINDIGHSVADINKICVDHLNEDFSLMQNLPYGKILSDMTGLCIGLNTFESINKSSLNNLVSAPVNSKPPNPFTGNVDTQILLECMNIIESEEVQESANDDFINSAHLFKESENLDQLLTRVQNFNTSLEKVQMFYANLEKPPKNNSSNSFGRNASQKSKQKFDDPKLKEYLKAIEEGKGLGLEYTI